MESAPFSLGPRLSETVVGDLNEMPGTTAVPSLTTIGTLLFQIAYVLGQRINLCFGKLLTESRHLAFAV